MGAVSYNQGSCGPQSIWQLMPDHGDRQCRPAPAQPRMGLLLPNSPEEAGKEVVDANGVRRHYCAYDGDGFLGSRGGAKASVDFIYLAPVLGRGVQVRDLCEVTSLWRSPEAEGGGYAVHVEDLVSHTQRAGAGEVAGSRRGYPEHAADPVCQCRDRGRHQADAAPRTKLRRQWRPAGHTLRGGEGRSSSFRTTPSIGAFTVDGHTRASLGVGGFPGIDTWPLPRRVKARISRHALPVRNGCR